MRYGHGKILKRKEYTMTDTQKDVAEARMKLIAHFYPQAWTGLLSNA